MCVGFREVAVKRRNWLDRRLEADQVQDRPVPVVLGPHKFLYLVDRHHIMIALMQEGIEAVPVNPIADFSSLPISSFWQCMHDQGLCWPHDDAGIRRPFLEMPSSLSELKDDPYRSLAGELRRHKGFHKHRKHYSEFAWADFLRQHISMDVLNADFSTAVALAQVLARSPEASHLPGLKSDVVGTGTAESQDLQA